MEIAVTLGAALMLAGALQHWAQNYWQRLPEAPSCPLCRGLTSAALQPTLSARLWALLPHTALRRCERCGWQGRMRWRWATQHASWR